MDQFRKDKTVLYRGSRGQSASLVYWSCDQTPASTEKEVRHARRTLLASQHNQRFDAVLVYRYDRFARNLRQLVNALAEFDALGIHFVSLHEGVDTSTPNGRLVFGIFASIAKFERELIRSRVRSGLAAPRAKGKQLGRPTRFVDATN
jgi:DNA invertase Pin-like site-specific DNA recombinase